MVVGVMPIMHIGLSDAFGGSVGGSLVMGGGRNRGVEGGAEGCLVSGWTSSGLLCTTSEQCTSSAGGEMVGRAIFSSSCELLVAGEGSSGKGGLSFSGEKRVCLAVVVVDGREKEGSSVDVGFGGV